MIRFKNNESHFYNVHVMHSITIYNFKKSESIKNSDKTVSKGSWSRGNCRVSGLKGPGSIPARSQHFAVIIGKNGEFRQP